MLSSNDRPSDLQALDARHWARLQEHARDLFTNYTFDPDRVIANDDAMFQGDLDSYLLAGRLVAERIRVGELGGLARDEAEALLQRWERDGFGFATYEHDGAAQSVDQVYGRAVASPSWVTAQLQLHSSLRLVKLQRAGLERATRRRRGRA